MKANKDCGTVSVSARDIAAFNRTWPCSSIPERACFFAFERNGDLVDTNCRADGPEVVALSHDAFACLKVSA